MKADFDKQTKVMAIKLKDLHKDNRCIFWSCRKFQCPKSQRMLR